jgi:beta-glucosidase
MASYNEIDGVPSHANPWLLQQVLRQEWGFPGFVVADYNAISELDTLHHVAANKEEAARLALETGVDLELPDPRAYPTVAQQVRDGRLSESVLDRAVARILRAKFLAGLFEHPYADPDEAERVTNSPAHQALALEAARKAIVLLKNDRGLLPLDRARVRKVAVIGPNAERVHLGGYSDDPGRGVSILEGIRTAAGSAVGVEFAEGVKITKGGGNWYADKVEPSDPESDRRGIAAAVRAARASDVAVVVLGDNEETSREAWSKQHLGDRASLDLFGRQEELLEAVVGTGRPTVLILINGRPASVRWAAEHVPAILEGWYLGQETGTALADVLFGDVDPSGKLPITIPRSAGHLPAYYNHKPSARRGYLLDSVDPLFPFGHGLSYTSFRYGDVRVMPAQIGPGGSTTVTVDVTNAGGRAGDEIVQLYVRDLVSSVTRPVKELRGFRRVTLAPGETKTVEFRLGPAELSFHDARMQRVVEPGAFEVIVGPSSAEGFAARLEVVGR